MTTRFMQDLILDAVSIGGRLAIERLRAPAGEYTIETDDPSYILVSPDSANENIIMPLASENVGRIQVIENGSNSNTCRARNTANTTTIGAAIPTGDFGFYYCNGDSWAHMFTIAS